MEKQEHGWGYLVVWEFRVQPGLERRFEEVYGSEGTWAKFFRRSERYLGTELLRDTNQPRRYVTLDFWTTRTAYENFRRRNLPEYEAIDKQCEQMTERELQLGSFERVRR